MRIFLTGATGFVGTHLLRRLLRDGHQVHALVRSSKPGRGANLQSFVGGRPEQLSIVEGDVVSGAGLDKGVTGCDAVIHLVGIILETGSASFERVHVLGTENVVRAARQAGVKRYVQMSALGVRPDGVAYQATKYRAEEIVRASGIPNVILRPSLIFGPGDGFVTQMVKIIKSAPVIPVVGNGQYRFRPVYVEDVAECFTQSLTREEACNRAIHLVGGEELTLEELLQRIAECIEVRKAAVHIPMPLMKLSARGMSLLPFQPPVTLDQLRMLEEGSTADAGEMEGVFAIKPIGFSQGLRLYLCPRQA